MFKDVRGGKFKEGQIVFVRNRLGQLGREADCLAKVTCYEPQFEPLPYCVKLPSGWGSWCRENELDVVGANYKIKEWLE